MSLIVSLVGGLMRSIGIDIFQLANRTIAQIKRMNEILAKMNDIRKK